MSIRVENLLNHELERKLSGDEKGRGPPTGGPPCKTPKGRLTLEPGGECFAPRFEKLGHPSWDEGRGAKHSLPGPYRVTILMKI